MVRVGGILPLEMEMKQMAIWKSPVLKMPTEGSHSGGPHFALIITSSGVCQPFGLVGLKPPTLSSCGPCIGAVRRGNQHFLVIGHSDCAFFAILA